ncbi:protein phosphatase 2C domain-containing protein [Streptomyces sp. TG1A-8]|uniref:protein phosphatase 2C domain-containing protein n=1 Tax=Streptomyces sp. TG1A-8 TaxID=3051385 RepID=UPI00265BDC48|nr:protein phosphatase 2C domain-containing protein [Streptomyces sp. TG1A-8]MDO0925109.1 protein phosphatase 2C domain-containing protein [Streptomyces sp. TG1A-8]
MNQQGGTPARHEDDWWGQLYDDSTGDTGPTAAPDSLDDRFASARNTVTGRPAVENDPATEPSGPEQPSGGPALPPRRDASPSPAGKNPPAGVPRPPIAPPTGEPPAEPVAGTAATPPSDGPAAPADGPVPPAGGPTPPPPAGSGRPAPAGPASPPGVPGSPGPPGHPGAAPPAGSPWWGSGSPAALRPAPPGEPARERPEPPLPPMPAVPAVPPVPPPQSTPRPAAPHSPAGPSSPPSPPSPPSPLPSAPPPAAPAAPAAPRPAPRDHVGSGAAAHDSEPTALPPADPDALGELVADTVLDGARYGACTVRAVSLRGDAARYRGEPRRDALLIARFGAGERALVLVAMAAGARATPQAHRAAAEACRWIGQAVGRSHRRLAEDIRAARRGELKSGLQRLTDRTLGKLRAGAAEQGADPEEYTAGLRCLLLPADPDCRTRVFFGVGDGGLFRLRDGAWQDIEPVPPAAGPGDPAVGFGSPPGGTAGGDRLTTDLGIPTPPSPYEPAPKPPRAPFRFRASVARPGDALVMCTPGLADPLRGEPALCTHLARRWSCATPPGLAAFLTDVQVRVEGYDGDRTAAAVWEA